MLDTFDTFTLPNRTHINLHMGEIIMQKIYRLKNVIEVTGMSRSTIYRLMDQDKFPKPIKLTQRIIGFLEEDIDQWIQNRYQEGIKHESE